MALFVTGTSTDIGKTMVSALLLARYSTSSTPVHYWKPVATGTVDGRDSDVLRRLAPAGCVVHPEYVALPEPLSPHLAARRAGVAITTDELTDAYASVCGRSTGRVVVEGAGGLLVPLWDDGPLLADWLAELKIATVVVAASTLGTINHTLLTLEAARTRGIDVRGVILNGPPNPDNRDAIVRWGDVRILGQVPPMTPPTRQTIAETALGIDPDAILSSALELHERPCR